MKKSVQVFIEILTFPYRSIELLGCGKDAWEFTRERNDNRFYRHIIESFVRQNTGGMSIDVLENSITWCFFDAWKQIKHSAPISLLEVTQQVSREFLRVDDGKHTLNIDTGSSLFGDKVSRSDKALAWRALCLKCSVDLFFAASLLELEDSLGTDLHLSGILFDPWPRRLRGILDDNKGLAENHLHSGSAFDPIALWPQFLLKLQSANYQSYLNTPRPYSFLNGKGIAVFSLCGAIIRSLLLIHINGVRSELTFGFIDKFIKNSGAKDCADEIHLALNLALKGYPIKFMESVYYGYSRLKPDLIPRLRKILKCIYSYAFFTKDLSLKGTHTYKEEISFLYKSLCYIRSNPTDNNFNTLFWDYIRTKNIYHRFIVQHLSIEGLTFFRNNFFDSGKILKPIRKKYFNNISSLISLLDPNNRLKKIEIRTSPDINDIDSLLRGIQKHEKEKKNPSAGIIVHFVKNKRKKKLQDDRNQFDCISKIILTEYMRLKQFIKKRYEMSNQPPRIVGLDVAGAEMDVPNWVFLAPFTLFRRWWRRKIGTGRIGYTFHAGEDFYTIMQGLRHVGEIILFFPWEDGDRIGHGLSLSMDVDKWLDSHSVVVAPRETYLDDMLWELHLYRTGKLSPPFHSITSRLEGEIIRVSEEIYGQIYHIEVLIRTYTMKFDLSCMEAVGVLHDFYSSELDLSPGKVPSQLSQEMELLKRALCDHDIRKHCEKVEHIHRLFSPKEEKQRVEAIQAMLLKLCNDKNIAIESCPTSNLLIRGLRDYCELPCVSLLRNNHNNLLINTDNPMTFATSLDEEYLHVYLALKKSGANNPEQIIKNCRNASLNFNFA